MRQHMAYLNLLAKGTFYKVLIILAAALAGQAGLFLRAAERADQQYGDIYGPEAMVDFASSAWVLGAAFLLITVVLCLNGCQFGSKSDYTLRRLSLSANARFFWQAGFNTLCYLLLWAAETVLMLLLCRWFIASGTMKVTSHQTLYLTFYRSELLHSLLPLANVSRWIRNILLIPALGLASARFSHLQRQGKFAVSIPILTAATLIFFVADPSGFTTDLWLLAPTACVTALLLSRYFMDREDELP